MAQTAAHEDEGKLISVLGEIMEFKVTGAESGGSLCMVELTAFPHNGPPPHIHHREDESFYVLEGKFSFLLSSRTIEADSCSFAVFPRELFTHIKTSAPNQEGRWLS